jgi:hypothetical protein
MVTLLIGGAGLLQAEPATATLPYFGHVSFSPRSGSTGTLFRFHGTISKADLRNAGSGSFGLDVIGTGPKGCDFYPNLGRFWDHLNRQTRAIRGHFVVRPKGVCGMSNGKLLTTPLGNYRLTGGNCLVCDLGTFRLTRRNLN